MSYQFIVFTSLATVAIAAAYLAAVFSASARRAAYLAAVFSASARRSAELSHEAASDSLECAKIASGIRPGSAFEASGSAYLEQE